MAFQTVVLDQDTTTNRSTSLFQLIPPHYMQLPRRRHSWTQVADRSAHGLTNDRNHNYNYHHHHYRTAERIESMHSDDDDDDDDDDDPNVSVNPDDIDHLSSASSSSSSSSSLNLQQTLLELVEDQAEGGMQHPQHRNLPGSQTSEQNTFQQTHIDITEVVQNDVCPIQRIDWQAVRECIPNNPQELSQTSNQNHQAYWVALNRRHRQQRLQQRQPVSHTHNIPVNDPGNEFGFNLGGSAYVVHDTELDFSTDYLDEYHDEDFSFDRFEITLFHNIVCHDPPLDVVQLGMQHCTDPIDLLFYRPSLLALAARFEASEQVISYLLRETINAMNDVGMVLAPIEWCMEDYIPHQSAAIIVQNYPDDAFLRHRADKILLNELVSIYDSPIRLGALEMDDLWDGSEDWWNESRMAVWDKLQMVLSKVLLCQSNVNTKYASTNESTITQSAQPSHQTRSSRHQPKLQCLLKTATLCKRHRLYKDTTTNTHIYSNAQLFDDCIELAKLEPLFEILRDTKRWDSKQFRIGTHDRNGDNVENSSVSSANEYPLHALLKMRLIRPNHKLYEQLKRQKPSLDTGSVHRRSGAVDNSSISEDDSVVEVGDTEYEIDPVARVITILLDTFPEAVSIQIPGSGMYPLHLAALNGWPIDRILSMYPPAVQVQSHKTSCSLYPFQAAVLHFAVAADGRMDGTNAARPATSSTVVKDCDAGLHHGSNEDDDEIMLEHLGACYTLLREYPSVLLA